jgi:hypothetical protein
LRELFRNIGKRRVLLQRNSSILWKQSFLIVVIRETVVYPEDWKVFGNLCKGFDVR